ncbi:anti-sigma-D factor RsdA [Nocardia mexicana]|uniref:Anti-sigma-D factor RsdA-like protein n=1 Tax=Nocardia mexicana TaxID=279262 RepID=A0A370H5M1_9NOCA|nr:anti-sigma-D factor RsdA [Nocardia mexicana]RDI51682.1 anti-sigma-D factor RsdA-like protein [Nocardia mexicana]
MARDGERGRGDWKARLGSHSSDPYAEASGDTGPVDIAAVRRDDALIDAIAGDGAVTTDSAEEYQLATLLANWRAEIVDEPLPAGPDLDAVVASVNQEIGARQARVNVNRRSHLRLIRPIMGAAAALALIMGGMTAFSYSAQPGDPLWRVKEVVFSQQAQTTIAQRAEDDMTKAATLMDQGRPEQAKALLASAGNTATQVDDNQRKNELERRWNELWAQLNTVAPEIAASLTPPNPPKSTGRPTPTTEVPTTGWPTGGATKPSTTVDPRMAPNPETDETAPGGTKPGTTLPTTPSLPTTGRPTTLPHTQDPPTNEPTAGPSTIGSTGASIPEIPTQRTLPDQPTFRPTQPSAGSPSIGSPSIGIVPPGGSVPGGIR